MKVYSEAERREALTLLHSNETTLDAKTFATLIGQDVSTVYIYLRGHRREEPLCAEQFGGQWLIPRARVYKWIHPDPECNNTVACIEGSLNKSN